MIQWYLHSGEGNAVYLKFNTIKNIPPALAGVVQWTECWPINQNVTGPIASQGTCMGCMPGPQ